MVLRAWTGRIIFAAVVGAVGTLSWGADVAWQGNTGNWNDPGQWVGGVAPSGSSTDQLTFAGFSYTSTVTADHDPWVVNGLTLNTQAITLAAGNTSGIQLDGALPFIAQLGDVATISSPVVLGQTATLSMGYDPGSANPTGFLVTMSGAISGAGGLNVNSGEWVLASANSFAGGVTLNGASTVSQGDFNGNDYITGATVVVGDPHALGTGALNLLANGQFATAIFNLSVSTTMGNDVNVSGSLNRILAAGAGNVTMGNLTFGAGNSSVEINQSPFDINTGAMQFGFSKIVLVGNGTLVGGTGGFGGPSPFAVTVGGIAESGGARSLTVSDFVGLTVTGSSSYSGGTTLVGGEFGQAMVNANVNGALGSGPVSLSNGTLTLNATGAAHNTVTSSDAVSVVNYNANGGAGGHLVTAGQLVFGAAVSSFSGSGAADTFATVAGGLVSGTGAQLGMLDRSANFNAGVGTTVQNTSGGLPTVKNLGTAGDLVLGLVGNYAGNLGMGPGSPWMGNTGSNTTYTGVLTTAANFTLSNLSLGNGTAGSFGIVSAGGASPAVVSLQYVTLNLPGADYSG